MNPAPGTMAAEVRHYGVAIRSCDVLLAALAAKFDATSRLISIYSYTLDKLCYYTSIVPPISVIHLLINEQ